MVDPSRLPVEIIPEGGGKPWKMVAAKTAESQPAGFAEKLSKLYYRKESLSLIFKLCFLHPVPMQGLQKQ